MNKAVEALPSHYEHARRLGVDWVIQPKTPLLQEVAADCWRYLRGQGDFTPSRLVEAYRGRSEGFYQAVGLVFRLDHQTDPVTPLEEFLHIPASELVLPVERRRWPDKLVFAPKSLGPLQYVDNQNQQPLAILEGTSATPRDRESILQRLRARQYLSSVWFFYLQRVNGEGFLAPKIEDSTHLVFQLHMIDLNRQIEWRIGRLNWDNPFGVDMNRIEGEIARKQQELQRLKAILAGEGLSLLQSRLEDASRVVGVLPDLLR